MTDTTTTPPPSIPDLMKGARGTAGDCAPDADEDWQNWGVNPSDRSPNPPICADMERVGRV
jgi:hypothetical protein